MTMGSAGIRRRQGKGHGAPRPHLLNCGRISACGFQPPSLWCSTVASTGHSIEGGQFSRLVSGEKSRRVQARLCRQNRWPLGGRSWRPWQSWAGPGGRGSFPRETGGASVQDGWACVGGGWAPSKQKGHFPVAPVKCGLHYVDRAGRQPWPVELTGVSVAVAAGCAWTAASSGPTGPQGTHTRC